MELIQKNYAVGLILDPKGKMLLQRKDDGYFFGPGKWCTFGGGLKNGEDPRSALEREILKENGLTLEEVYPFRSFPFSDVAVTGPKAGNLKREGIVHCFGAKFDGNLRNIRIGEGAGFSLFSEQEIRRYNELDLVIPYNAEYIFRFYESLK